MIRHTKRPLLYVDDTVEQRYAMRRILETEGFVVLEAGTGKEALALMTHAPALAVVDVRLPDINGYELSRRLKELQPYMPILQVSASFSDPDLRAAGLSGGADAYIAQPVHASELVALIRRMLQSSEAEEYLRFLATIGPHLNATLSLPTVIENVKNVMIPYFADRCFLSLSNFPGGHSPSLPEDTSPEIREALEHSSELGGAKMLTAHLIVAPLSLTDSDFGIIAFELNSDREYTVKDQMLAADLANRAGLSLQNCVLFASEQATRAALVQSEKLATAGRMSAAIAHEINNPLEALTNLIFLIEHSPEATDSIREIASTASTEITRLSHIASQTLGSYRELRAPSSFELSQTVLETVEIYKKRMNSKGIQLTLNLAEAIWLSGIKGEIRQVISNLLVNAIEAMEEGGSIVITTRSEGDAFLLLQDTGPGIPDEIRSKIFEPFFTTKPGTGTGLGLWITKTIVEKHNGTIDVECRKERNRNKTTFRMRFPLSQNQAA